MNLDEFISLSNLSEIDLLNTLQYDWNVKRPYEEINSEKKLIVAYHPFYISRNGKSQILMREIRMNTLNYTKHRTTVLELDDLNLLNKMLKNLIYKGYELILDHNNNRIYTNERYNILVNLDKSKKGYYKIAKMIRDNISYSNKIEKSKEDRKKKNQAHIAQKKRLDKLEEIRSTIHDLKKDFPKDYDKYINRLKSEIVSNFRSSLNSRYYKSRGLLPRKDEIYRSRAKFVEFKSTYSALIHTPSSASYTERKIKYVSGSDEDLKLFKHMSYSLPVITVEGIRVRLKLDIPKMEVMYTFGYNKAKIKNGHIDFKYDFPNEKLKNEIIIQLKERSSGKYYFSYETFKVIGEEELNIEVMDNSNKSSFDILGLKF